MKKIILSLIFSYLILMMANQSFATTATVNATAVRIREKASIDANIVTNIYKEDEVEILEENGEWYKVKYGEKEGYAKAEFFSKKGSKVENTTIQNTIQEEQPQNTTIANNIENQASTEQNVIPNQENTSIKEMNVGEKVTLPSLVKLRLVPNFSTNEKMEIAQGTEVTIESILGNWYKITDGNVSGWITKSKFITKSEVQEQEIIEPTEELTNTSIENDTEQTVTEPEQPQLEEQQSEQEKIMEEKKNRTAIVIVETARVRKTASKSAEIIDVLDEDDIVTITEEEGSFYKISTEKIPSGYISKSLVKEKNVSARSMTEEREEQISYDLNDDSNNSVSQEITVSVTGNDVVQFAKQFLGYPYVLRLQYS